MIGWRRELVAAAAVAVLVAVVGCGGGGGRDGGSADASSSPQKASETSSTTTSTSEVTPAPSGGETRSAGAPAVAASPSTTTLDIGNGLKIKATLASACVKPGGEQSITIDIGRAGGVAYNSFYSDGKSGGMENFYGGNNGSSVDDKGTWQDTWVVGPTAPAGPVRVDVVAIDKTYLRGHEVLEFEVAKPSGRCS